MGTIEMNDRRILPSIIILAVKRLRKAIRKPSAHPNTNIAEKYKGMVEALPDERLVYRDDDEWHHLWTDYHDYSAATVLAIAMGAGFSCKQLGLVDAIAIMDQIRLGKDMRFPLDDIMILTSEDPDDVDEDDDIEPGQYEDEEDNYKTLTDKEIEDVKSLVRSVYFRCYKPPIVHQPPPIIVQSQAPVVTPNANGEQRDVSVYTE